MFRAHPGFQAVALASALTVIPTGGCTSSYQPAPGPRIATVMDDGELTLVRDGRSFSAGFFGGGVVDAVEGNSAALEHAHTYRQYTITGWSLYLAGLGLGLTGIGLWQAGDRNGDLQQEQTGEALALGGVAALITGVGFLVGAQPHLWDAINLYNDEVDRRARLSYWPNPTVPPYVVPPVLAPPALAPSSVPQPGPAVPGPAVPSPAAPSPAVPSPAVPGSTPSAPTPAPSPPGTGS